MALLTLPREEEPQISVPMVDIHRRAPTATRPSDAVELVTEPLETSSRASTASSTSIRRRRTTRVVVTARFVVGTDRRRRDPARAREDPRQHRPHAQVGIPEPLIVGRGINDVAIVDADADAEAGRRRRAGRTTASPRSPRELQHRARQARRCRPDLYRRRAARTRSGSSPIPSGSSLYGITLQQLVGKLAGANRSFLVGALARAAASSSPLVAGQTLQGVPDIGLLLLTARDGRPVYVRDVADVVAAPPSPSDAPGT